jgi:hypothetical protein
VDARKEGIDTASPDWTQETVTIDTGYGERMLVRLYVPKNGQGPKQAVVFVPGLGPSWADRRAPARQSWARSITSSRADAFSSCP